MNLIPDACLSPTYMPFDFGGELSYPAQITVKSYEQICFYLFVMIVMRMMIILILIARIMILMMMMMALISIALFIH